jgi:hypothetical protein
LESWRISSYRALKAAPAAIPTATAEKQHDDNVRIPTIAGSDSN